MDSSMPKPGEYWIRDVLGNIYGPLTHATIELFLENGMFKGAMMASADGVHFDVPGSFPNLREAFPKGFWGLDGGQPAIDTEEKIAAPSEPRAGDAERALDRAAAVEVPAPCPEVPEIASQTAPMGIGRLPFAGAISFELPPLTLCHRAVSERATGLLTLQSDLRRYAIYFRKGSIESVESPRQEEDLGAFAVAQHTLSPEQLQAARARGGDIIDALFALNLLDPATTSDLVMQHRMSLLFKAILLSEGRFAFRLDAARPPNAQPLGEHWTPLCQVARAIPRDRVFQGLGCRIDWPVMPSGGHLNLDIRQLSLTAQERRISSQFDGTRSLVELCDAMPDAQALPILRTAYLLACLEVISFASEGAGARTTAHVGFRRRFSRSTGTPTNPPARFGSQPPLERQGTNPPARFGSQANPRLGTMPPAAGEAEALRQLLSNLSTKNHFEVLGVPQTAEGSAFKLAFFKLAKTYHPDTAIGAAPEVAKLKADIFARMNEAYQVLDNPISRAQYLESLQHGGDLKIDVASVLAAEEKYFKATIFLKNRRYKEALALMDEVIALNAQEGEFIACRGFAAFLAASDKAEARPKALQAIEEGLALNPRCAEAHFFRGQIEKISGNIKLARESFQEALKLNPKHVEAQRELKWLDKR